MAFATCGELSNAQRVIHSGAGVASCPQFGGRRWRATVRNGDDHDVKSGEWARDPEWLYRHSRGGVITVARLGELGVPSMTCYRRCRPGKPWQRLLPGVLLLHSGTPTRRQLVDAALLYAGPDAVVTGAASCRRQGLRALPDHPFRVHLLVPLEHKIGGSGHVIVERTIRMPQPIVEAGVPMAPLVRSVLDESRRLGSRRDVSSLLSDAVQCGVSLSELFAELDAGSSRGTAIPREALHRIADGARSAAEVDAMTVWRTSGLPEPLWNHELRDENGEYIATPDGYFVAARLAWEIDSYDFHFGKQQYAATVARNARYAAAGIAVLQTLPSRLRTEPKRVADELVAVHQAALARSGAA
ncbi:hypothetical protein [Amycolatopsis alba]|uniref:hypothetical protein n=1 Tax=Amycolatopsis alba TaxID=76020 RepID=UPI001FD765FD|nr:hypothetical protein [Amycolatopsis alba]